MLYRPEAFERFTDEAWNPVRIRAGIREIVADTEAALRGPKLLWRADEWDGWRATSPMKNLYVGAAGVLWALDELRERGHAETDIDLGGLALGTLERFRERPDFMRGAALPEPRKSSLLCGETGILLVAYRLVRERWLADDLYVLVRANAANEADEIMWGAPGTMIAALLMLGWTDEERWRDAWSGSASALLARPEPDGFWTQRLYGMEYRLIGPAHGMVGNVLALLQGGALLPEGLSSDVASVASGALERTAVVENGLANWPMTADADLALEDGEVRVQWCHGAPGVVCSASTYLAEDLLLAGAELTWRAGPHGPEKGPSICHGTAGNGYAFLKTFARTGDELWLGRARRFAVHALGQVRRRRTERARGRYSLWTGDLGVALYLADCLDGRSDYPALDS